MLALNTPGGVPVRVHVSSPKQLRGLRTGMRVKATGQWGAPASARASAAAVGVTASGLTTLHFSAATLRTTSGGPAIAKPLLEIEGGRGAGGGAGIAAATGPAVVLSTNPLTARDVSVLVIPSERRHVIAARTPPPRSRQCMLRCLRSSHPTNPLAHALPTQQP